METKEENTVSNSASLEAEWASFEMMIGGSDAPLPVAAPEMKLQDNTNSELMDRPHQSVFGCNAINFAPKDVCDLSKNNETSISHLIGLSTEYNPEIIDDESSDDDGTPMLPDTKDYQNSSPEHSSHSSSSSLRSRSSSANSVKEDSVDEKTPPHQNEKDDYRLARKVDKRSRSRSRSRSPHSKSRRSSDRRHSPSRSRRPSDRKRRSRSHGKRGHHKPSHSSHHRRRSSSRSRPRSSRERPSSRDRHLRKGHVSRRRRSKDRRHGGRNRDHRRSRSHSREHRRSRSRSPGRSGHGSRTGGGRGENKNMTFKEKMRQQLLKASKLLTEQGDMSDKKFENLKEKPSILPLNASNVFQSIASGSNVTPQMALLQTMAAMHQKAQEMTGVAVPKYYNPAAVNPLKYAEQVQKRKLLWSKNKEKTEEEPPGGHNQWQATSFVQDQDGKMAAKFRKLMGMKEGEEGGEEEQDEDKTEDKKKQTEELFYRLDKEYEFARMTTHTHRGIGLGFQSQTFPNP